MKEAELQPLKVNSWKLIPVKVVFNWKKRIPTLKSDSQTLTNDGWNVAVYCVTRLLCDVDENCLVSLECFASSEEVLVISIKDANTRTLSLHIGSLRFQLMSKSPERREKL